jgi:DNA-binding MarR family transcriptional regulator
MGMFHVVYIRLTERSKELLKRYDVPFTHLLVMDQIEKEPGITVSELARQSGLAKSYISTTIEELSLRGMADKRPDKNDQRLTRVFLTGPANNLLNEIRGCMEGMFTSLLEEIPDAQIEALTEGLASLQEALEKVKVS